MPNLLTIEELNKAYSGVNALSDVSMTLQSGEVHALCGENGAGKSTLIKCLTGITVPDTGNVRISGQRLRFGSVAAAEVAGIAVIHQEATFFPDLNAVDNVFVGRELKNRFGMLDHQRMRGEVAQQLKNLGQDFDVLRPVSELSLANRQMVMMARALSQQCKLMIMDEPTASLSAKETSVLLQAVKSLRKQGVAILYVSHRLPEVFEIADRVSVLRDGTLVGSEVTTAINETKLIRMMVGRDVDTSRTAIDRELGQTRLEVAELSGLKFSGVSLSVRSGEIVGVAGLVGAGRSEVARAIMGLDGYESGTVYVQGAKLPPRDIQAAINAGIALVPEDRQHEGLVLPLSVSHNMSLSILQRLSRFGWTQPAAERKIVQSLFQQLQVKSAGYDVSAESLSGGNQQKLVLGKWLATEPNVLMLDEPTRGIDVGAKAQVHQLIRSLAAKGMATLIISSELPELLAMCDRILVMREGKISGDVSAAEATQEAILQLAVPIA